MAKSIFGAGLIEGIFLGLFVKTGLDISGSGIALMVVNAIKTGMAFTYFGVAVDLIVLALVVGPWLLLIKDIQKNGLPFIIGIISGFLLIVLFG